MKDTFIAENTVKVMKRKSSSAKYWLEFYAALCGRGWEGNLCGFNFRCLIQCRKKSKTYLKPCVKKALAGRVTISMNLVDKLW